MGGKKQQPKVKAGEEKGRGLMTTRRRVDSQCVVMLAIRLWVWVWVYVCHLPASCLADGHREWWVLRETDLNQNNKNELFRRRAVPSLREGEGSVQASKETTKANK